MVSKKKFSWSTSPKVDDEKRTEPISATVFERIEIKTIQQISVYISTVTSTDHWLVNNKVLDKAANMVMRIGPKRGWKLDACPKLRDVLPNQIWTINQAMDLNDQLAFPTGAESARKDEDETESRSMDLQYLMSRE